MSWQRLIYYLGLAVVEATPPALLLTLAGGDAWGVLIVVVLAGGLADWVFLRRVPPARQGAVLAAAGLLVALWAARSQVAPGAGLLGGWGQALGALFFAQGDRAGLAYLSLLAALYCFWRGTRLTQHDTLGLHRLFRTATILLMLIVGIGFFGGGSRAALASVEVLAFFAAGLITIAMASASAEREAELRRMGWRGLVTLLATVALVLFLGLLVGALFGREAAFLISLLWQGVVLIFALVLTPILYVLALLLEQLLRLAHLDQLKMPVPPVRPGLSQQQAAPELLGIFPPWAQVALRVFFALLPILLIAGLFLLSRARARRKAGADEERESLWSWRGLAADLRGLLRRNVAPAGTGLRDALARLRGDDPASRIRRSYIRLLLAGEAREQPRAAPQTPHEYVATATGMLPAASQPIDALTGAYERARYHPSAATLADADAAEQAWDAIERADRATKHAA
jgi:hypothetical protein